MYGRLVDKFQAKLLLLIHIVSGLPARATEILTVRIENIANMGTRNVFTSYGQMCFIIAYYKNFQQSNQAKIIYQFIPPKVGALLVWYIWLVLPFWQSVQGTIKQSTFQSVYVWADKITSHNAINQAVDRETGGRQDQDEEGVQLDKGTIQTFCETKWSSDQVRRIIQQYSKTLLGYKLSISSWR